MEDAAPTRSHTLMEYFAKPTKPDLIIHVVIWAWILIVNVAAHAMHLEAWPMYFIPLFFFLLDADVKKIVMIFASSAIGIILAFCLRSGMMLLAPAFGEMPAFIMVIAAVLGILLIGGTYAPGFLNNIAFAYLIAASIMITDLDAGKLFNHLAVLFIGGGIMLGGCILLATFAMKKLGVEEGAKDNADKDDPEPEKVSMR